MTRLIRSLIWVAASTFAVGCAPTMMSTDADHNPPLRQMVEGDAPSVGAMEGPVTVFSILNTADASDRKTYVLIRKRVQQSEGKLRWVYRSKARGAALAKSHAKALIAAQAQGKHWEFADRVADSRAALSESQLLALAEDLEMDSKAFEEVFTSPLTKARLDADSGYALKLGSSAQSTVWVNGRTIAPWSEDQFNRVVNEELEKAQRLESLAIPAAFISPLLTDLNRLEKESPTVRTPKRTRTQSMPRLPIGYSDAHMGFGASESNALVTLVVFHDYQCSFCKRHDATLRSLVAAYPGRLRVVIRHNPLKRHALAPDAAAAALAAEELGRGNVFHRALVESKEAPSPGLLNYLAASNGMDPSLFAEAMSRHRALVDQDVRDAKALGATGTPHTFVNGRRVKGAIKRSALLGLVQEELLRAEGIQRKTSLSGRGLYDRLVRADGGGKVGR